MVQKRGGTVNRCSAAPRLTTTRTVQPRLAPVVAVPGGIGIGIASPAALRSFYASPSSSRNKGNDGKVHRLSFLFFRKARYLHQPISSLFPNDFVSLRQRNRRDLRRSRHGVQSRLRQNRSFETEGIFSSHNCRAHFLLLLPDISTMISITKLFCGAAVALVSSPRVFAVTVDEDWVIQYQVCKPWKLFCSFWR